MCGVILTVLSQGLLFVMQPPHEVLQRRCVLATGATILTAPSVLTAESAQAETAPAGPPEKLEVSGISGTRFLANGNWYIVEGKKINGRALYKKDGSEYYLMVNDCGAFQISTTASGTCDGFAQESKGKWVVDGKETGAVKIKPVKKAVPTPAAAPAPGNAAPAAAPDSQEPEKKADPRDVFDFNDINVNKNVQAQGGIQGMMTFREGEADAADRLMARLNKKR